MSDVWFSEFFPRNSAPESVGAPGAGSDAALSQVLEELLRTHTIVIEPPIGGLNRFRSLPRTEGESEEKRQ